MQLNFDVFGHKMKVKVAEKIFWGQEPPRSPILGGFTPNPPTPSVWYPKNTSVHYISQKG